MADAESFVDYFQSLSAPVKHGDVLGMFAALYNRVNDPRLRQNRDNRPDRTRVIPKCYSSCDRRDGRPAT
jgi:hypothetical protein